MSTKNNAATVSVDINWETWEIHKTNCSGNAKSYNASVKGTPKTFRTFTDWKDATDTLGEFATRDGVIAEVNSAGDYLDGDTQEEQDHLFHRCLASLPWEDEMLPLEEDDEDTEEEWDEEGEYEAVGYYGPILTNARPTKWSKFFDTSFEVVDSERSEIQFRVTRTADGRFPFGHIVVIMEDDENVVSFENSNMTDKEIDTVLKAIGETKFFDYLGKVTEEWLTIEENIYEQFTYSA